MRISNLTQDPENPTLKAFQDLLQFDVPEEAALGAILARIQAEKSAESALRILNHQRPRSNSPKDPRWFKVRTHLDATLQKARNLRIQAWQLDPKRRTLRLGVEIRHPASALNASSLSHTLANLLIEGGLPIAMGLEKKPRPMISLGPPLPLGVEGLCEWVDLTLQEPLKGTPEACIAHLNSLAPEGLRLLTATFIPNHSSTLLDLAQEARWRWEVPVDIFDLAHSRMEIFEAASFFEIEKTGKIGGSKTIKRINVRAQITRQAWDGSAFLFSTRMMVGEGLSPVKLLAGILEVEPAKITHLTRLEVLLGDDPRLVHTEKYEVKLHNIYEDAVLLESGESIQIHEDEDDELLLGR